MTLSTTSLTDYDSVWAVSRTVRQGFANGTTLGAFRDVVAVNLAVHTKDRAKLEMTIEAFAFDTCPRAVGCLMINTFAVVAPRVFGTVVVIVTETIASEAAFGAVRNDMIRCMAVEARIFLSSWLFSIEQETARGFFMSPFTTVAALDDSLVIS